MSVSLTLKTHLTCELPPIQSLSQCFGPCFYCVFDLVESCEVFDRGRHFELLPISNALHCSSQYLSTAGFGQTVHENYAMKLRKSTHVLSHLVVDHLLEVLNLLVVHLMSSFSFKDDIS